MDYSTVKSVDALAHLGEHLDSLPETTVVSYDVEATGLATMSDYIVGFSLSWEQGQAVYVPTWCPTQDELGFDIKQAKNVIAKLKRLRIIAHKWVYDSCITYTNTGVALPLWDDTLLLAHLLSCPLALKDAMIKVFGVEPSSVVEFQDLMSLTFGKNWHSRGFSAKDLEIGQGENSVDHYGCMDADYGRRYYYYLKPKLKQFGLLPIHKVETNLLPYVRKLNLTGVPVNPRQMKAAIGQVRKATDELEQEIYKMAGTPEEPYQFKINSPRDCPLVLFDKLKMPVILRSKATGSPSTSKEVMEQLSGMHPIVDAISTWRNDSRMITAYLEKIPQQAERDKDSRIYTEFNSLGAVSGRFTSSSNEDHKGDQHGTNLQNQSKKLFTWIEDGVQQSASVREAYVAPPGWTWVRTDFSQIEPRVGASIAQETYLLENFKLGIDSHTSTTMICFKMTMDEVLADKKKGGNRRGKGKIINLAIGYGMGVDKLARSLHVSKEEAEIFLERYWEKLPKIANMIQASKEDLIRTNQIRTFFGRLRILDVSFLKKKDHQAYDSALRKAWNTKIQGTAADILKIAMVRVFDAVKPFKKDVQVVLTVHDELDFLVKNEILFDALPVIRRAYEVPTPDSWADMVSEIGYGPNWDERSHTPYTDRDPEPFTGWKNVLPASCTLNVEPEYA